MFPLWFRYLALQTSPHSGGTLKVLRGVLPVEVMARRQDLAVVPDLGRSEGKTVEGADGMRLSIVRVQSKGAQLSAAFSIDAGPGWAFDPNGQGFELSDGQGRRIRAVGVSASLSGPPPRPPGHEELEVLGGDPTAGFPGGLPWAALAAYARGSEGRWAGSAQFVLPEKTDPAALTLTFYRYQRLRRDLPFEFHDLPLP